MIRAAVGISTQWDVARAAQDVGQQVKQQLQGARADWSIAFASYEFANHLPSLLPALNEALETPYLVGCSAAGVLGGGVEIENGPALGVLAVSSDQIKGTPFLFKDSDDNGMNAGTRLGDRFVSSKESEDLLLVWPDPFHVRPDRLLQGLRNSLGGVQIAGGAASARNSADETFQFSGTESGNGAVSGIRLGGNFSKVIGVTQGCRPLDRPLRITGAHENLILEIEGHPALNVLREQAPEGMLDDLDWALNFLFVGLLPDSGRTQLRCGEYAVHNIVQADPEAGVLGISDRVREGQEIVFAVREDRSAREDLVRMLDHVAPEKTGLDYSFGLYFNCLFRGSSLYGEEGVDSRLIEDALPGVPLLGFFSNAEIGPLGGLSQLFTYTGVLVLVAE